MTVEALEQAYALLSPLLGGKIDRKALEGIQTHLSLIRQWNSMLSLVSEGDVAFLEERHLIDSLSLIPYVWRHGGPAGGLLDIGSGGGFPAIPIKCMLPEMRLVMIERSMRKAGFLQRVIATVGLEGVEVIHGNFPESVPKVDVSCITARAVERPRHLHPSLLKRMLPGSAFLCQGDLTPLSSQKAFHVEHIDDAWRQAALRRGELYIITHQKSS